MGSGAPPNPPGDGHPQGCHLHGPGDVPTGGWVASLHPPSTVGGFCASRPRDRGKRQSKGHWRDAASCGCVEAWGLPGEGRSASALQGSTGEAQPSPACLLWVWHSGGLCHRKAGPGSHGCVSSYEGQVWGCFCEQASWPLSLQACGLGFSVSSCPWKASCYPGVETSPLCAQAGGDLAGRVHSPLWQQARSQAGSRGPGVSGDRREKAGPAD